MHKMHLNEKFTKINQLRAQVHILSFFQNIASTKHFQLPYLKVSLAYQGAIFLTRF